MPFDHDQNHFADGVVSAIRRLAASITPCIQGNDDASGSHVESLTEAVMGVTAGLCRIADAIEMVAERMEK